MTGLYIPGVAALGAVIISFASEPPADNRPLSSWQQCTLWGDHFPAAKPEIIIIVVLCGLYNSPLIKSAQKMTSSKERPMKTSIILSFLLLPTIVFAQNYGNMSKGDMQNMMQVMQQVQQCMADIDQTKLKKLQTRSEQAKKKIDTLCAQGKRDEAQKQAISFGKNIASDPTIKQMQKCGEMAQGAMPMPGMVETYDEERYANQHVCDE